MSVHFCEVLHAPPASMNGSLCRTREPSLYAGAICHSGTVTVPCPSLLFSSLHALTMCVTSGWDHGGWSQTLRQPSQQPQLPGSCWAPAALPARLPSWGDLGGLAIPAADPPPGWEVAALLLGPPGSPSRRASWDVLPILAPCPEPPLLLEELPSSGHSSNSSCNEVRHPTPPLRLLRFGHSCLCICSSHLLRLLLLLYCMLQVEACGRQRPSMHHVSICLQCAGPHQPGDPLALRNFLDQLWQQQGGAAQPADTGALWHSDITV